MTRKLCSYIHYTHTHTHTHTHTDIHTYIHTHMHPSARIHIRRGKYFLSERKILIIMSFTLPLAQNFLCVVMCSLHLVVTGVVGVPQVEV